MTHSRTLVATLAASVLLTLATITSANAGAGFAPHQLRAEAVEFAKGSHAQNVEKVHRRWGRRSWRRHYRFRHHRRHHYYRPRYYGYGYRYYSRPRYGYYYGHRGYGRGYRHW